MIVRTGPLTVVSLAAVVAALGAFIGLRGERVEPSASVAVVAMVILMARPPKTENQMMAKSVGAKKPPKMTSRTVRPREMRATKKPTKGAQVIHHALATGGERVGVTSFRGVGWCAAAAAAAG